MCSNSFATRILFIDSDEEAFAVQECVARVISGLPPMELFHARTTSEALSMLNSLHPHVVVLDDEKGDDTSEFFESLGRTHPPVLLRCSNAPTSVPCLPENNVAVVEKNETLAGCYDILEKASSLAMHLTS